MRRAIRPLLLVLILAVPAVGCSRWRTPPMRVPVEAGALPGMAALRGGDPAPEIFNEAFPPMESFIMSSRVLMRYRRILGKTYLELSMVSAGPTLIRLAGRHPGDRTTVFDLVFDFPQMHVYLPLSGDFFTGAVPPEGSPFGERFGVEPWDLIPVVQIGQRLAVARFTAETRGGETWLVMSERDTAADGLARVRLDGESGLPREVYWRRGEVEQTVLYEAWGVFPSIAEPEMLRLMPTEFTVQRANPWVRIEVRPRPELEQYKLDAELTRRTFELIFPRATSVRPLEELSDLLGG
jgi:hypothetical protein